MKKKHQVFTPGDISKSMLDMAKYNDNLYGKKVLENAVGDGNIFSEIVERYILNCIKMGYSSNEIKKGLEKDLFAYEIDEVHYRACINRINVIANKYQIENVKWSVYLCDFLKTTIKMKFDYVIGNPPYIKYNDLDIDTRSLIKSNFECCAVGKPDYCYAFIEKSISLMSNNGVFVYLIPNSVFKNTFADRVRHLVAENITTIRDYSSVKIFSELTTSAIIMCKKNCVDALVTYEDVKMKMTKSLNRSDLKGKWLFKDIKRANRTSKFVDYFFASSAIATLKNDVYVLKNFIEYDKYIEYKGFKIEKDVLRNASSIKMKQHNRNAYIIFPYYLDDLNQVKRYREEELKTQFPYCYKYLNANKLDLLNRDNDTSANWFEYGRSQAINKMFQEKLMISKVFSKKMQVYAMDDHSIPFSGNIVIKKGGYSLDIAKKILESTEFYNYAQNVGTDAQSNSIQISPKDINEFEFNLEDYIE